MGINGLLDIADIAAIAKILMNEIIDVTKLQFDRRPHIICPDDFSEIVNDFQAALDLAPMVVS